MALCRPHLCVVEQDMFIGLGPDYTDKEMDATEGCGITDIWLLRRAGPLLLLFKQTHPAKLSQSLLRMKKVLFPGGKPVQVSERLTLLSVALGSGFLIS